MLTRRQFIATSATVAGGAALVSACGPGLRRGTADPVPGGTLDPTTIQKYVTPLFILPAMPGTGSSNGVDTFSIAARPFRQQILPAGEPATTVFGYGNPSRSGTFHTPGYTIEASTARQTRVRWANQLVNSSGKFVPHLLTVDPTLHWANPPGGNAGRDTRPTFTSTPGPYRGPVPTVVHLHGAHVNEESDGYPEAWFLPQANNVPSGYATVGSFYDRFKAEFAGRTGVNWAPGTSTFQYRNDQRATALWYHDHSLGMTRTNIYSGLDGFYLLRGGSSDLGAGVLPGPAPKVGEPAGTRHYEIPLMIQCKSFNSDGSLFFPTSRDFFGDATPGGPFIPVTDLSPYWNPEFFGNTMVVNGNTWPTMNVEARRYRFRIVNASNTRVLMLKIVTNPLAARPAAATLPFWVIGTDGGFLPRPVRLDRLTQAVAERFDVIVDFTGVPAGTQLFLINEGPDEPFGGGEPVTDFDPADPGTTGQVMRFVVGAPVSADHSVPPAQLSLPSITPIGAAGNTRKLSLNEMDSTTFPDAPTMGMLGTLNSDSTPNPLLWGAALTENPGLNSTEVWELHNFTEDGHPIHVHQVQFQVLSRQPFDGTARGPETWESGFKDTVIALPGEITRIKAKFDIAGRYVWHCHIIDHEDNEMMRPFQVGG